MTQPHDVQPAGTSQRPQRIRDIAHAFARDERGATAIEYALLIAMIAMVCIVAFGAVGGASGGGWDGVAAKVSNAMK
jgi:pilus assembly protein Flp/PilA